MAQSKWFPTILCTVLFTGSVFAEANRTFFTQENQFPRWEQLEVGVEFTGVEVNNGLFEKDASSTALYLRYGLLDDLAVEIGVPFNTFSPPSGSSEAGLGDVSLGFQLRAYEDIFGYPYFIPYFNVYFPTGSDSKNLGEGDFTLLGGISFGSKINEWVAWAIDVGYRTNNDEDNTLIVGHSYVWEISEQLGILTELQYEQSDVSFVDDTWLLGGGFTYDWTPSLQMDLFMAGAVEGPVDMQFNARLSYSF